MGKQYVKMIIALISVASMSFGLGMLFGQGFVIDRHKEIIKENNGSVDGYDRFDLHYITFGEKI